MLIGNKVYVVEKDMTGEVIDETKNTLIMKCDNALKRIIKDSNRFIIYLDGKAIKVKGDEIRFRPWEYAIR